MQRKSGMVAQAFVQADTVLVSRSTSKERDAGSSNENFGARELINIASNRYVITTEGDCEIIGRRYVREMLERAEGFWKDFSNVDVILSVLKQVPGKGRHYAETDLFASERAIMLMKQRHGMAAALELAGEIAARLAESTRNDLATWLHRAESAWRAA